MVAQACLEVLGRDGAEPFERPGLQFSSFFNPILSQSQVAHVIQNSMGNCEIIGATNRTEKIVLTSRTCRSSYHMSPVRESSISSCFGKPARIRSF